MATFPSRQFYLSQIIGTGASATYGNNGKLLTAADPWRPAVWDEAAGDKAVIHVPSRSGWVLGTTPTASCLIRAYVTQTEHATIIADSRNAWLGFGEDIIMTAVMSNTETDAINQAMAAIFPGWTPLAYGLSVIAALEAVSQYVAGGMFPGGSWWAY